MKTIDKEIMRLGIYLGDEYDTELYNSLILKDSYLLYSPSKVKNGIAQDAIYQSGRFERIKVKTKSKTGINLFDFNLN
jgi:hypothetical protein